MKHFLLFCLFWLPVLASAQTAVRWRFDSFQVTATKPGGAGSWTIESYTTPSGATKPSFSGSVLTSSSTLTDYNVPGRLSSNTSNATSSYITVGYSITGVGRVNVFWKQLRPDGEPDPLLGGGFGPDGQRQGPNGHPVDDNGVEQDPDPPDPPTRYFATATYHNTTPYAVTIRVIWTATGGGLILTTTGHCEPGASYTSEGYNDSPFVITLQPMMDGADVGEPITAESDPVEDGDPDHPPPPDPGQPGGEGGPPANSGGQHGGNAQVPMPAPITPSPRPGEGDGNDEARHQELRGELGRIVDQLNAMGNQAADDADRTNELLAGISESAEQIAENTSGEGSGEGPGPSALPSLTGPGQEGEDHEGFDELSLPAKVGAIRGAAAGMLESAAGLKNALGLGQTYGDTPLAWSFTIPPFGIIELDLDAVLGTWIPIIRQILLFFFSLQFVVSLFKTLTSAFT